ncbi:beta-galactosidase [Spirochaetia bacterium]|nr:beta-galactosidase [Spirochaetia bacterium]
MKTLNLQNWKFSLEKRRDIFTDPWAPGFDDTTWQDVIVPHDWAVTFPFSREYSSGTGYLPGGTGWYRTRFSVAAGSFKKGEKAFVNFDGVYKNSQVWCNGYYLGKRPGGYTSFRYDISGCLHEGDDNVIAVKVSHEDFADSRWFTGSGIHRNVTVELHDAVYIKSESVRVKTVVSDSPEIIVTGEVINDASMNAEDLRFAITVEGEHGEKYVSETELPGLIPGASMPLTLISAVPNAKLWSADTPNLYRLTLELTSGETIFKSRPINVGIRSIRFDPDKGFFINGKSEKLKGVCFHHDSGCLGAAFWKNVWRRRLTKLKAAGCNAVRTSHNPHSPELYDLCDEMGFYVMDEAFDEWEGCKNKWYRGHNVYPPVHEGYYEDFPQWHERDLADMVIRDRNHPSVIMWSIGNEIDYPNDPYVHPLFSEMAGNNDANKPKQEQVYNPQKPNMERLALVAAELAAIVKKYDDTRPILTAAAFPELSSRIGFFDALDMVGYNYKEQFYEADHKRFPNLPILGSENGHHLEAWKQVRDNDYISGQFLWTGIDFLGEARGWPIRGSGAGILDLAGNEKPLFYRRKILWNDEPDLFLSACPVREGQKPGEVPPWELTGSWNYHPGDLIHVVCWTNLDTVELFLNGKSLGVKNRDSSVEYAAWIVPFERGKLEARGKDAQISCTLESNLPASRLRLTQWQPSRKDESQTGGWKLAQVEIEVLDENDRICINESPLIKITLGGGARLLGLENGDISDCMEYAAPYRRAFRGLLIAYVLVPGKTEGKSFIKADVDSFFTGAMLEL